MLVDAIILEKIVMTTNKDHKPIPLTLGLFIAGYSIDFYGLVRGSSVKTGSTADTGTDV